MTYKSYTDGREIEAAAHENDWPYYGLVLAAKNIVDQLLGKQYGDYSVFSRMLDKFGYIDEFHGRAAKAYAAVALTDGWTLSGLIQALMRMGDTTNRALLVDQFPEDYADLLARYNAPGGKLEGDDLEGVGDKEGVHEG